MATLDIKNLNYSLSIPSVQRIKSWIFNNEKIQEQKLLHDVNLEITPGLTAILGPSGCGKTTLIDCLAGRKRKNDLVPKIPLKKRLSRQYLTDVNPDSFSYKINNKLVDLDQMHLNCAYIQQDDILTEMLTVSENIDFSIEVRTSTEYKMTSAVRNQVIQKLGLEKCKNHKIGGILSRGVSGGERKRTAIAMELAIDQQLLFLDEPTTGLDSSTSFHVIKLLRELGQENKTILISIHQPRSSIWELLDNVILMYKGKVMYHGNRENCVNWLENQGYKCPEYENPADHIMDVLQENGDKLLSLTTKYHENSKFRKMKLKKEQTFANFVPRLSVKCIPAVENLIEGVQDSTSTENIRPSRSNSSAYFSQSSLSPKSSKSSNSDKVLSKIPEINNLGIYFEFPNKLSQSRESIFSLSDTSSIPEEIKYPKREQVSFWRQFKILAKRSYLISIREPKLIYLSIITAIIFSLFIGCLYYRIDLQACADDSSKNSTSLIKIPTFREIAIASQNTMGSLIFMSVLLWYTSLQYLKIFSDGAKIFKRETNSGYYKTGPYFLSVFLLEIFPSRLIPTIAYSFIAYFMIGLVRDFKVLFLWFMAMMNISIASGCLLICLTACFEWYLSIQVYVITSAFSTLVTGFFIGLDDIPWVFRWLKYISIPRYTFESTVINEAINVDECFAQARQDFIKDWLVIQNFGYQTYWKNFGVMVGLILLFLVIGYYGLRIKAQKRD